MRPVAILGKLCPKYLFWLRQISRGLVFFLRIHREQHVVVEAVFPIIAVASEVEVDLGTLGKPQLNIPFCERYGAVLDHLVLASQADLGKWIHQLRLDAHNLELVGSNPGAAF